MKHLLTYGGKVKLKKYYISHEFSGNDAQPPVIHWPNQKNISSIVQSIQSNGPRVGIKKHVPLCCCYYIWCNNYIYFQDYGFIDTARLYMGLKKMNLTGKNVLVIGSITPWVEELILSLHAAHVTTLEYREIKSYHNRVCIT